MLPVHKKTKTRRGTRRSHHALRPIQLISCPQCGQARQPHTACGNCGHVTATTSIQVKTEES